MTDAVKRHWPEYLMEAAGLGLFMISAAGFAIVLFHPAAPAATLGPLLQRILMGMVMGLTAIALIHSPWGKQSGAHFNPAVTLTFLRLGRIAARDGLFYIAAQFLGGIAGVVVATAVLGGLVSHPAVHFVATLPGSARLRVAVVAEVVVSF